MSILSALKYKYVWFWIKNPTVFTWIMAINFVYSTIYVHAISEKYLYKRLPVTWKRERWKENGWISKITGKYQNLHFSSLCQFHPTSFSAPTLTCCHRYNVCKQYLTVIEKYLNFILFFSLSTSFRVFFFQDPPWRVAIVTIYIYK